MSLRKNKLVQGEIYHIYNRGVDKRDIFMDENDRFRFIHDLYEFNDKNPAIRLNTFISNSAEFAEVGLPQIKRRSREILVEILAFCMMDNHFHMLVRQKEEDGITLFMRKIGTGYTNYFNKKYERTGALFQGKFKSVHIENESHFMYLPIYIHLNPLDFNFKEWREGKISDPQQAINFLDNYRWSSYMDYIGNKNFPSLINKDFLLSRLGNEENFRKEITDWVGSSEAKMKESLQENIVLE